jgi:spore maturation protein CgeB
MGNYLAAAAETLRLDYQIMDIGEAEARNRIVQSYYWRVHDKRPAKLRKFAMRVLNTCALTRPDLVLTTGGRVPLERLHIENLRELGIRVVNYSTDDPWNPVLRAPWFISAVPSYDVIFTPRRANIDDFRRCPVRAIHYMPFGYDPAVHRPWPENTASGAPSDVLFVGGCDAERLPLVRSLIEAGLNLALFGQYWGRHRETRRFWRGVADQDTIRAASATAGICLCLVRRANRDGHVMRSLEAAAIGGCILAEDTPDHREIFGREDEAARYFKNTPDMVKQAKALAADHSLRRRLALGLARRIRSRSDTYADRLMGMLRLSNLSERCSRSMDSAFERLSGQQVRASGPVSG